MRFELEKAIEVLERTPGTLSAMLSGLSEEWTSGNEGDDTFSPRDVVGHLLHGEATDWIPRVEIVLNHGEAKAFAPFDRFAFREKYRDRSLEELLEDFANARTKSLEHLRSLKLEGDSFARTGKHPELGRVTLSQLLATWTAHDLAHVRQVARVMAKQYHEAVGPWERYLRVFQE